MDKRNNKFIYLFIILVSLSWIASMPYHKIDVDEAWLGEQAHTMSLHGYSNSNLFHELINGSDKLVVQHKLFIYAGALSEKVFGFGIGQFRLVSILSALCLVFLLYKYSLSLFKNKDNAILTILALFIIPFFFYWSKIYRPELLVTVLGFASFIFLEKYILENKKSNLIFAAALSGFATLSHLNGLIFAFSGFILLAINRKFLDSLYFTIISLFVFSPYLVEVYYNYDIFIAQINGPLIASKTHFSIWQPVLNLATEHQRLFRKPEIIVASLPFFFSLILNWKYLMKEKRVFLFYLISLIVFLGAIAGDKSVKTATYLAPFYAIVISLGFVNLAKYKKSFKIAYIFVIALFVSFSFYYQTLDILKKNDNSYINSELGKNIPENSRILAPMNYIYDEVDKFNVSALLRVQHVYGEINIHNVAKYCDQNNVKYVVINKQGEDWENFSDIKKSESLSQFFTLAVDNNFGKIYVRN